MADAPLKQCTPLAHGAAAPAAGLGWAAARCVRSAPNHLECTRCTDACPEQALHWRPEAGNPTLVITDGCHGCGACLPACPSEALLSNDLQNLESAIQSSGTDSSVQLVCHRVDGGDQTSALHCLRSVGTDQVMQWVGAHGQQAVSLTVADDCQHCPAAPGAEQPDTWWQALSRLDVLSPLPGRPFRPAAGAPLSRRSFLSAQTVQPPTFDPDTAFVDARRQQRAHRSGVDPNPALPALVLDDQRCLSHEVCVQVCPTEALLVTADHELTFAPLHCIECGYCEAYCPEQALSSSRTTDPQQVTLRADSLVNCFHCGRDFSSRPTANAVLQAQNDSPDRAVCPACERDQQLVANDFQRLFG